MASRARLYTARRAGSITSSVAAHGSLTFIAAIGPILHAPLVRDRCLDPGYDTRTLRKRLWTSRRRNHDDVSPRDEPWGSGPEEPYRSTASGYARGSRVSAGAPVDPPASENSCRRTASWLWVLIVRSWIRARSRAYPWRLAIRREIAVIGLARIHPGEQPGSC